MESNRAMFKQETHVVSVMVHSLLETVANLRDEKDDRFLPHQIRRQIIDSMRTFSRACTHLHTLNRMAQDL